MAPKRIDLGNEWVKFIKMLAALRNVASQLILINEMHTRLYASILIGVNQALNQLRIIHLFIHRQMISILRRFYQSEHILYLLQCLLKSYLLEISSWLPRHWRAIKQKYLILSILKLIIAKIIWQGKPHSNWLDT